MAEKGVITGACGFYGTSGHAEFSQKKHVVILCDSWYMKQNLVSIVDEYENLDLVGNARSDSVIYDLAPAPTGHRGRPAKHGRRLSVEDDFILSNEKVGDYYTGVRRVLTNLFGTREVLAYVTSTSKTGGTKRLFFSTIFPEDLQIFCAWQEQELLNHTGSSWMVRSCKGIEIMVNLINIAYCGMKLLPYQDERFSNFRDKSVQDFRFALSKGLHRQVFFATFVHNIETRIKSSAVINALKQLFFFS